MRRRGGGGAAANPSVLSNGPSAPRSKRKRQQKPQPFAYDVPTHTRVAAVSLCCFVASLCLYGNTAFAEFVWDDRAAVPGEAVRCVRRRLLPAAVCLPVCFTPCVAPPGTRDVCARAGYDRQQRPPGGVSVGEPSHP